MSQAPTALDRTSQLQSQASDPQASAWVSANAGSGKTYVLSRRVLRLLLRGADPSKILCLTFTKAAAAEMTRRVFDLLAKWTECDDAALEKELSELAGHPPSPQTTVRARKLFALALETPGGLKIQTIHAFCEALLQRFPIEANVPGHFRVLDERDQVDLIGRAKSEVFAQAPGDADAAVRDGFATLLEECSDHAIDKILGEIIAERHMLEEWIRRAGGLVHAIEQLRLKFEVKPGASVEKLDKETVNSPNFSILYLRKCMQILINNDGKTDPEMAERIGQFLEPERPEDKAQNWVNIFLTKTGTWRATKGLISKAGKAALPNFTELAELEIARLEALAEQRRALAAVELTGAFLVVGSSVLTRYDRRKTASGFMDFEDLIVRSLDLLSKADAALWVQYKLDQGIDHILVDEAQDTSPRQWEIVRALGAEFFAGETDREGPRTLFAVGDEKQSIYSFQGADPKYFTDMRRYFQQRAEDAGQRFNAIALRLSFRSTPDVLSAVDRVFADEAAADGLSHDKEPIQHDAVRFSAPGDVSVWPLFSDIAAPEPDDWSKPIDVENPQSAKVRLAERIAAQIGSWLEAGERLPGVGKPIAPGDILVLVRKRDAFVAALIRALKARGIPVAGSDRLMLTDHIAVNDLVALGQVMVLREDDLSLAAVLKCPLFDWSEEDLFTIAHRKKTTTLWRSLEAHASDGHGPSRHAWETLRAWMGAADFERPFEFYSRILDSDGGRRKFKARFGGEVDDVIDQFMLLTLDSASTEAPSLDRFLARLQRSDIVIKRELSTAGPDIRIMTVHGAKGLEAPIVFLVDPGSAPRHASHDPAIIKLDPAPGAAGQILSVCRTAAGTPTPVAEQLARNREASEQEYRRLLYVALTRAEDRLIVCGYQGSRGAHARCWHKLVWTGLESEAEQAPFDGETTMLVWQKTTAPPVAGPSEEEEPQTAPKPLPGWALRPAEALRIIGRLSPSSAIDGGEADEGGPKVPPRDVFAEALAPESTALRRGRLIHRLLEILPEQPDVKRRALAESAVGTALPDAPPAERGAVVDAVLAILEDPRFADLFSGEARAEVSISGFVTKTDGVRHLVSGQIDRLLITGDTITVVDYKTNRFAPQSIADAPVQYIAQLALYRKILSYVYPNHAIKALLFWTSAPAMMPISETHLDDALRRILTS